MDLEIPEEDRAVLADWLGSTDDRLDKVLSVIEGAKPTLRRSQLVDHIAHETSLDADAIGPLVDTLINVIHTVAAFSDDDRAQAVAIVGRAIGGDDADRTRIDKRLDRILQSKALEITGKAYGVLSDNPNLFCSARTLSELRPVFDRGLDARAAVIVHQLKLVYHTGPSSERSDLFLALDRSDLDYLKTIIDRAIEKHDKLEAMTKTLNLPLL